MNNLFTRYLKPTFSLKEQTSFIRRLAFLVGAGVPLVESLHMLQGQMRSKSQRAALEHIINATANGQMLSRSFAKFPRIFSAFSVQMVHIGEQSGTLSQNLNYLADELQKRHALRSTIISAFMYPLLITTAILGMTVFLMMYLLPKILPVFSSLGVKLPLPTRVMIAVSTFLGQWGILLTLVFGIVVFGGVSVLKRNIRLHTLFDKAILHTPLFGRMIRSYNVANACRTLGLLLKSGLQLSESLVVTADTTGNLVYKQQYRLLSEAVNRGEKISTHLLQNLRLFPDVMGHTTAVGERSGTLQESLAHLSFLFDREVDDSTKHIATLIEPLLMITMGVLVGGIAVSIITPIYGITQNIHIQ